MSVSLFFLVFIFVTCQRVPGIVKCSNKSKIKIEDILENKREYRVVEPENSPPWCKASLIQLFLLSYHTLQSFLPH